MKAAGGVSNSKAALHRLVLVKETLGDEWLTPDRFRIGASSLLNDLLMQYQKTQTGPLRAPRGLLEGVAVATQDAAHDASSGTTRRRRSRPTTSACATATGCSSTASSATRPTARACRPSTRPPRSRWPRSRSPGPGDVRRAVEAARAAQPGWAALPRARARQVPVPHRPPDPGARARAGDRRVDRRRQADPRVARRRRPAGRRALLPLRRLGRQALVRRRRARRRAARRRRRRSCRGTSRC